jgi:hypothetical protein
MRRGLAGRNVQLKCPRLHVSHHFHASRLALISPRHEDQIHDRRRPNERPHRQAPGREKLAAAREAYEAAVAAAHTACEQSAAASNNGEEDGDDD